MPSTYCRTCDAHHDSHGLPPQPGCPLLGQAEMLARGLGRNVDEFTFTTGGRHGSTWASLEGNDTKWLL